METMVSIKGNQTDLVVYWFYTSQGRFPEDVPGINASNAIMMEHVRSLRWAANDTIVYAAHGNKKTYRGKKI